MVFNGVDVVLPSCKPLTRSKKATVSAEALAFGLTVTLAGLE